MKKIKLLLPLIGLTTLAASAMPLVSCKNGGEDTKTPTFTVDETIMTNNKVAHIELDWEESEHSIEVSEYAFQYGDGTNEVIAEPESLVRTRPFKLKLTFTNEVTDNISDGVFSFHFNDSTTGTEGNVSVTNITIYKFGHWGEEQAHIIDDGGAIHIVTSLVDSRICDTDNRAIHCDDGTEYSRTAFNLALELNPNLKNIDKGFLSDCERFKKPISLPNSLESIGDSFMARCYLFNKPLSIPNSLETIGTSFMKSCTAFSQQLTLPTSLQSVGSGFMTNCQYMKSSINIQNLHAAIFEEDSWTLATGSTNVPMYIDGIEIVADTPELKAEFINRFPTSEALPFRNLK